MFFCRMVICIMNIYFLSFLSKDAPIVFVFSFVLYVLDSVTNPPPAIISNPISLLLSVSAILKKQAHFLHKPWFLSWKTFISEKYSNFFYCNSYVYFENIVVCNEPLTVEVHTFAKWLFNYFQKNAKAATWGVP